jgi:hypothetical protein
VIYNNNTLLDLSQDTVSDPSHIMQGYVGHLRDGNQVTGTGQGGSAILVPYAVRPDADLIHTVTYDKRLVEDLGQTMPAYSTTAKTLVASASLSPTVAMNQDAYNYIVVQRLLAYPIYKSGTAIATGHFEYWLEAINYDIVEVPGNTFKSMANPSKALTSRTTAVFEGGAFYREIYWANTSTITSYSTNAYGVYMTATAPSATDTAITLNSPALMIRGHTTRFRSAVWSTVEDVRYQYVIQVYRAPKGNLNLDGWGDRQGVFHIVDCIDNNSGTLT